jgi:hypothetical protein
MCAGGPPNPVIPIRPHSRAIVPSGTRSSPGPSIDADSLTLAAARRIGPGGIYLCYRANM